MAGGSNPRTAIIYQNKGTSIINCRVTKIFKKKREKIQRIKIFGEMSKIPSKTKLRGGIWVVCN